MQWLFAILEEAVPFVFYVKRANEKLKEAASKDNEKDKSLHEQYGNLAAEELMSRLKEEHERGKYIDEKTIKFSVTIGLALTILGSAGSVVLKSLSNPDLAFAASILIAFSVIYSISGGLLALGALKTLPMYGFGTSFLLEKKKSDAVIVSALISQEKVNIVRHLRNESAYQCLRNGLILLLLALFIYAVTPATKYFSVGELMPPAEQKQQSSEKGKHNKEQKNKKVGQ